MDGVQARPNRGFVSRNVRFEPGRVKTRYGFTFRVSVAGKVTSFHNWITSSFNRIVYYEGLATAKIMNLADYTITTLFTLAGRGLQVAESGDKAFIATYDADGMGAGQIRISLPSVTAGTIDKAFAPPWTNTPNIADAGAGNVTEGLHKFAYIVESRTGFTGKPSPQPSNVFTPTSFTVAAGGRALTMSMTVNVPADAAFVHPIMTRIDNLDRWYFVPDAQVAVPGGSAGYPISISINISDEHLADGAEEANEHFNALAQVVAGTGPINPSNIASYGKRMVYFVNDKVYISDPDDYQFISEDQHVIQVPGKRRITNGFQLRGSFYLIGPGWTHEVSDNGDLPSTWATPTEVSSAIGTLAPKGVEWRTAGDYAWVASTAGLYLFDGRYQPRPISYFNTPEWKRINWNAAYAVEVRDDYVNQQVYVSVPLDAATEPTHWFVWDYSRGLTPEDVDFSMDNLAQTVYSSPNFGAIALIQDPDTLRHQLWVGPPAAGPVIRQDELVRTDNFGTIDSVYETGFVLGRGDKQKRINRFGGLDFSVEGEGEFEVTINGIDRLRNAALELDVIELPGESFERKFDLIDENVSIRFEASDADNWFDVQSLTLYWKPYATNRPG